MGAKRVGLTSGLHKGDLCSDVLVLILIVVVMI